MPRPCIASRQGLSEYSISCQRTSRGHNDVRAHEVRRAALKRRQAHMGRTPSISDLCIVSGYLIVANGTDEWLALHAIATQLVDRCHV